MSTGNSLRELREQRHWDLDYIAREINISAAILNKIEAEQFREIGAPVYVRGYILNYARFLGMSEADAAALVDGLNLGHNPELHLSQANVESQSRSYKKSYTGSLILLVLLVVAIIAVFSQILNRNSWIMTQIRNTFPQEQDKNNNILELVVNNGVKSPTPSASSGAMISSGMGKPLAPAPSLSPSGTTPALQLESASYGVVNNVSPASDISPSGLPNTEEIEQAAATPLRLDSLSPNSQENASTQTLGRSAESGGGAGFQLDFTGGSSWVEILDKDKKRVKYTTVKKGEKIDLPLDGAPYSMRISTPKNVKLLVNGQEAQWSDYKAPKTKRKDRFVLAAEGTEQ